MSRKEILIEKQYGQVFAALVSEGRLESLYVDPAGDGPHWGDIFMGKVTRIDPGLDAAFVDIGGNQTGLLKAKDLRIPGFEDAHNRSGIANMLKSGDRVIVQVNAAAAGEKSPRLTMDIALRGRFLVHTPLSGEVTISRRVEKKELLNLASRMDNHEGGWIIRAAASDADFETVMHEANALSRQWATIKEKLLPGDPHLAFKGPNAALRMICDHAAAVNIEICGREMSGSLRDWSGKFAPDLSEKMKTVEKDLLEMRDVNSQVAALTKPDVALTDGAGIIIEPTQALTSIDINSGNQRDFFKLNLEAVKEAARQIRLRNISGIIMLDLVNLTHKADRERLAEAVDAALKDDPAGPQFHGLTRMGLAEITRPRRLPSLRESLSQEFLKTV